VAQKAVGCPGSLPGESCIISNMGTLESPDRTTDDQDGASLELQQQVAQLLDMGEIHAARDSVEQAIRESGRNAEFLWLLANVEFADGDSVAGASLLAEAVQVAGEEDVGAVGRQIHTLAIHKQCRLALLIVESLPSQASESPHVRSAVGAFYEACYCSAHAVYGYGAETGLQDYDLARRRCSWLRSGGPFDLIRGRLYSWEESALLSQLRRNIKANVELESIPGIEAREAELLKTQVENAEYAWRCRFEYWSLIFRWQLRLLPLAVAPVWLVLYLLVHFIGFISAPPGPVIGTSISAAVAVAAPIAFTRTFMRSDLSPRIAVKVPSSVAAAACILAVAAEALIAEGYGDNDVPTADWWSWVVLGLITIPATALCMLCSAIVQVIVGSRRIDSIIKEQCEPLLILELVSILFAIRTSRRISAARRLALARRLEWAARQITHNLLPAQSLRTIASGDWLMRRAAGWAEALRYMQRELVTPVPGGQVRLEARLRNEIRCLAARDLGALAWRQPPPAPSKKASLAQKAVTAARAIVVAALPLGAVLAVNALTRIPNDTFRWAAIVSAAWGLLYTTLSLDPTLRDKIETARSLTGIIGDARKIR
jgi:hypothetical protein